jgi:hypothetical protein
MLLNAANTKVRKYHEAYAAPQADRLLDFLMSIHGEFLRLLHMYL